MHGIHAERKNILYKEDAILQPGMCKGKIFVTRASAWKIKGESSLVSIFLRSRGGICCIYKSASLSDKKSFYCKHQREAAYIKQLVNQMRASRADREKKKSYEREWKKRSA